MLAQFADGLRAELDFRREADAMTEMAARLDGDAPCACRGCIVALCTRRVLVQERFEGATVTDSTGSARRTSTAPRSPTSCCARCSTRSCGSASSTPTRIPGNVFVLDDGTLGLIDFGAVGRLDPIQQAAIVDILLALARRDVGLLRDGVERVANVAEATSADELERALARLMADHVRPGGTIDPSVMQELVRSLSDFGMRLPTDIVLLSRALVTVDGTLRVLCPGRSLMTSAMELMQSPTGAAGGRPQGACPRRAAGDAAPPPPAARARSTASSR